MRIPVILTILRFFPFCTLNNVVKKPDICIALFDVFTTLDKGERGIPTNTLQIVHNFLSVIVQNFFKIKT